MRDWTHQYHKTVIRTKRIYFTLKDKSFKISVQDGRIEYLRILQLSSKQEETDGKMLLAPNYACNRGVESITTHTIIESRIIIKIVSGKLNVECNRIFIRQKSDSQIYKIKCLNLVKKHEIFCDALCLPGESLDIEETVYNVTEQMVCTAYGFENVADINEVRYRKRCSKQFPDSTRIPPGKDELIQHVKKVNYQAFIWIKKSWR